MKAPFSTKRLATCQAGLPIYICGLYIETFDAIGFWVKRSQHPDQRIGCGVMRKHVEAAAQGMNLGVVCGNGALRNLKSTKVCCSPCKMLPQRLRLSLCQDHTINFVEWISQLRDSYVGSVQAGPAPRPKLL